MAQVNFSGGSVPGRLYFRDLKDNDSFVIDSPASKGAVYRKVTTGNVVPHLRGMSFMMEEATGKLFEASPSPVVLVDVDVKVKANKPSCY